MARATDNQPRRARLHRGAFTVVELLVVVAIIVLLMAILAPTFAGVGKRATSLRCGANLHQVGEAFAKRKAEMGQSVGTLAGNKSYFYPNGQQWPSIPYGNCKEAQIFACPSKGEPIGVGDKPDAESILKQLVYYCRNRGFYIELVSQGVRGYGHQHAAVLLTTGPEGRLIEFAVEDVDPPVTSILYQGDDGAVRITLDTFPTEATLIDGGCGEHNCLLYNGKPMFPQWEGKAADPASWYDPASLGTGGYYGYTGWDRRKIGQKVALDGLRCDYGINKDAYQMTAGETKAVIMDFDENQVQYTEATINDKLTKVSDRHAGTINVLQASGSVVNLTPAALNPTMPGVQDQYWKP